MEELTEKEMQEKKALWIEKGKNLIYPEMQEKWKKTIDARLKDLYHGKDMEDALEIIEALNSGASFEEAKKILLDQDHSGLSYSVVRKIIFDYSKQGPEFWEYTVMNDIAPESKKALEEKKIENKRLAKLDKKRNLPYYKVAKSALINWNGMNDKEAREYIDENDFDTIEHGKLDEEGNKKNPVEAVDSINSAIESLAKTLELSPEEIDNLKDAIYTGEKENNETLKSLDLKILNKGLKPKEVIMDTLFSVHDGWVSKYEENFNKEGREKNHQHMPSELIGWKEAKSDLLFIAPIFEAAGIEVNEKSLEQVYNVRRDNFFYKNDIGNTKDLIDRISEGEKFYPALKGYSEKNLNLLKDSKFVEENVIPHIEQKGVGNAEKIVDSIAETMDKEAAEPAKDSHGTIDEVLDRLEKYKEKGENVYIDFNGRRLWSCDRRSKEEQYEDVIEISKEQRQELDNEFFNTNDPEKKKEIIKRHHDITVAHREKKRENAVPIDDKYFANLDETLEYMKECKLKGENVYYDFNGVNGQSRIYSDDERSVDEIFLDVTGVTKTQDVKLKEEFKSLETDEEKNAFFERYGKLREKNKLVKEIKENRDNKESLHNLLDKNKDELEQLKIELEEKQQEKEKLGKEEIQNPSEDTPEDI